MIHTSALVFCLCLIGFSPKFVPTLEVANKSWCFTNLESEQATGVGNGRKFASRQASGIQCLLSPLDRLDIQIWAYIGDNRWTADCRSRLPLKSLLRRSGKYRQLHREQFREWLVKSVEHGRGARAEQTELAERTLSFFTDGDHFSWPVESTIFRLLDNDDGIEGQ